MDSGQTIAGKYRLNRIIGSGGMASVWSATNIFTEREFAIKFMLPQVARTPEAARRFLLEAKVSARINHPNIIEVIDVGQAEDGALFMVMELLSGQALETAMRRQTPPMPTYDFVMFMRDIARALAAAHRSGVIHRDLKPTNVFLHKGREGEVIPKILDFGVSKILEEETNHALTVARTVLGSPLYMSPEQAMGAPGIDGRTDIFAFGAIRFEALTGTRAFDAPNFNALIVTIATTQPKKIDDVAPHVPEALRSIVRDCLVTDKARRIASFDLIADRLQQALPSLERGTLRLPSPYGAGPPSDPDATNALPVMRPSDRPPSFTSSGSSMHNTNPGGPSSGPRSGNSPPAGFSAPWAPNNTLSTRNPTWALAVGAGGALAVVGLVLVVVALVSRGSAARGPASSGPTPAAVATQAPLASAPTVAPSSEPPVVSIDALPHASGRPGASAPTKPLTGHLSIAAGPGWCSVTIDGVKQGPTPIASLELTTGTHRVECAPPRGKVRYAGVTIQDGSTARYKFQLDD